MEITPRLKILPSLIAFSPRVESPRTSRIPFCPEIAIFSLSKTNNKFIQWFLNNFYPSQRRVRNESGELLHTGFRSLVTVRNRSDRRNHGAISFVYAREPANPLKHSSVADYARGSADTSKCVSCIIHSCSGLNYAAFFGEQWARLQRRGSAALRNPEKHLMDLNLPGAVYTLHGTLAVVVVVQPSTPSPSPLPSSSPEYHSES